MKYEIPGAQELAIDKIILHLNGTMTVGGILVDGVKERIEKLKDQFTFYVFSGDTRGNGKRIADELGITLIKTGSGEEKKQKCLNLELILV